MKKTRVVVAGLLILAVTGCKDKIEPGAVTVERPTVTGVTTMQIALDRTPLFHEAAATVTAEVESIISSRIMGPVAAISVKEGDRVKADQVLIVIESEDINNKVTAAEAAYREAVQALGAAEQSRILAENTYSRFKNLYDERALSRQEIDNIETQKKVAAIEYERTREMVKRAEAGLAEAKVFRGYKEIRSPVDGIVTGKFIDPGTMAMPGMRLLTIEDTSRYRLKADIDESLSGQITPGMAVEIEIGALKLETAGKVSEAVPAVDPRSRTFTIFISLPPETNLHSGLYARVKIPVGQQELILVPTAAVVTRGQLTGVYVVDAERTITYRLVRLGRQYGENIVAADAARVTDGARLQVEK
jgi:RND family efflux transporter MFP subunit